MESFSICMSIRLSISLLMEHIYVAKKFLRHFACNLANDVLLDTSNVKTRRKLSLLLIWIWSTSHPITDNTARVSSDNDAMDHKPHEYVSACMVYQCGFGRSRANPGAMRGTGALFTGHRDRNFYILRNLAVSHCGHLVNYHDLN